MATVGGVAVMSICTTYTQAVRRVDRVELAAGQVRLVPRLGQRQLGLMVRVGVRVSACACSRITTALRAASMRSGRKSRNTSVATAASTRMPPNAMHQLVPWLRRAPRQL